jgi:hypothetical protein
MTGYSNTTGALVVKSGVALSIIGEGGAIVLDMNYTRKLHQYGLSFFEVHGALALTGVVLKNYFAAYSSAVLVKGGDVSLTNCAFMNNIDPARPPAAGALWVYSGSAALTGCTFKKPTCTGCAGYNDVLRCMPNSGMCDHGAIGTVTFKCPVGTTGSDTVMQGDRLEAAQLPPTKDLVHCK